MKGADAIIKCLEEEKVEVVFGYPGVAIAPVFNSILSSDIRTVLVRQEQNAGHAASGYARITGKVGVAIATSGPGAENLITGIATAFADSIPMVCITGQVDSRLMGSDVFQEADISGAVESFVKYSYIIRNPEDIPRIFREAFYLASTGRKGPVLIDIPQDIQNAQLEKFVWPKSVKMRTYKPTTTGHALQIAKVLTELQRAKRPIICVGGGVLLANARDDVRAFAEKYGIPVVCTMMGLGVMPTEHPLFYGMVGNNGQLYGNRAMNEADMIIMAGARVADRSFSQPDLILSGKVLVHIDVDPAEIGKNAGPTIPLVGDLKSVFGNFLAHEDLKIDCSDWREVLNGYRLQGEKRRQATEKLALALKTRMKWVDPRAFVRALSLAMDDNAVYVADVGQNQLWSCANAVIRNGRFMASGGMGTMGYALPAAMGVKIARPDLQVVAVCGDGGFQMTMMELATMRYYGVQAKVVVLKNGWLGLVRQHQHFAYHDRFSVTDLGDCPHLDMLTKAYDMDFIRLTDNDSIDAAVKQFLEDENSVLMEVDVDPNVLA